MSLLADANPLRRILWEGMRKYVLFCVVVFGSLLTFFEYSFKFLEHPEVRLIIVPVLFCLGYFIYLSVDLAKRYLASEKRRTELSTREIEALTKLEKSFAELYGFRHTLIKSERDLHLDGTADALFSFAIVATRNGFSSRVHLHQAGIGTGLDQLQHDFRLVRAAHGHDADASVLNGVHNRFLLDVTFSPPLHDEDEVAYEIHETYKGAYLMTKEEVLDMIAKEHWLIGEPYESTMFLVIYPTDKLVIKVTFPYGYKIGGTEWFDVTVGESSYRSEPEYARLIKVNALDVDEIIGKDGQKRFVLTLTIDKPIMGLCYWIKWIPPSSSLYKKLLSAK